MKKITFDEEELLAIAVFPSDSRENTAARMKAILPELEEDSEYNDLELEEYREELLSEEEELEENPEHGDLSEASENEAGQQADREVQE